MENHQVAASASSNCTASSSGEINVSVLPAPPSLTVAPQNGSSRRTSGQPSSYLLTEENWTTRNRLFHAALSGDCKTARKILDEDPESRSEIVNSAITSSTMETALHVAAGANQAEFVEMLVKEDHIDLTLQDMKGNTAFCVAVAAGASKVVNKFLTLPRRHEFIRTPGGNNHTPLYFATLFGHGEIALQLYDYVSKNGIRPESENSEWYRMFINCIDNDIYELAIKMIEDDSGVTGFEQAYATEEETALHILSRKRLSVPNGIWNRVASQFSGKLPMEMPALILVKKLWERVLKKNRYKYDDVVREIETPWNLLTEAAEVGNFDFLVVLIRIYPELIWEQAIFHIAILNRHVKIFKLIHEIGFPKCLIQQYEDDKQNSILHFAARKPLKSTRLDSMSGPALQMRQELLWFKEVEKIVPHSLKNKRNSTNQTPKDVFTEEHADLMKDAEKWMKKNAKICLIVATIIVTVVFPVAFDIHKGGKSSNSIGLSPKPSENMPAILLISNAIAMSFSSIAIMLFLSILISRFTENELLWFLPCTFVFGLISLLISVTSMMVSSCFTFLTPNGSLGMTIYIYSLQFVPLILFLCLVYPVLRDIIYSTFFSRNKFNSRSRVLNYYGK